MYLNLQATFTAKYASRSTFVYKIIVEECRRREKLGRGTFVFNEDSDTFEVTE